MPTPTGLVVKNGSKMRERSSGEMPGPLSSMLTETVESCCSSLTVTLPFSPLYLMAFSRQPTAEEMDAASIYLAKKESSREAYEDLVWVLLNTKEFLFVH